MEDKIIRFLIEADAVSPGSAKTFREIMDECALNEATLRMDLNRMVQNDRISVSGPHRSILSRDAEMKYDQINALEMRPAGRDWTQHHQISLWLGSSVLAEVKESRQREEMIRALTTMANRKQEAPSITVHGDNHGIASIGNDNAMARSGSGPAATQVGVKGSVQQTTDPESTSKKILVGSIITVVGGLILWALTSILS